MAEENDPLLTKARAEEIRDFDCVGDHARIVMVSLGLPGREPPFIDIDFG